MFQFGSAYAFISKISTVRRFHITQPDHVILNLDRTMPSRYFWIVDNYIRIRASQHDARLLHRIDQAASWAGDDGECYGPSRRQAQRVGCLSAASCESGCA